MRASFSICLSLSFLLLFNSCKDDSKDMLISQDELQEVLDLNLSAESCGMADMLNRLAYTNFDFDSICRNANDTSFTYVTDKGTLNMEQTQVISYEYYYSCDSMYKWDTLFTHSEIDSCFMNYTQSTDLVNARLSMDAVGSGYAQYCDLCDRSSGDHTFRANWNKHGHISSKFGNFAKVSFEMVINLYDVKMNKNSRKISSGTGDFTIDVEAENGKNATYSATFTLLPDYKVSAIIEGRDYLFEIR